MRLHFVGIGGIGISALAQLCQKRGDEISGSDVQETAITPVLRERKIKVSIGHRPENVPGNCDAVIYSEAVDVKNVERQTAVQRNIPQFSYFEYLGKISESLRTIAVSGSHGKTTTTALIAAGSLAANFDATFLVGSTLHEFGESNFHAGQNGWLIVEACEYRENFRFLWPEIVLITNAELDHTDYFRDHEMYLEAFAKLCAKAKVVIFHEGDRDAENILKNFQGQKIAVPHKNVAQVPELKILGEFNRGNAALALALAEYIKIDISKFKQGIAGFSGAGRRQEFIGEKNGVKIYDDYGHHPTEIKSTIEAFRQKFPEKKIGLIFEPHQHSRSRQFFSEFLECFRDADLVGLLPIYAARDTAEDKKFGLDKFFTADKTLIKIETQKDAERFMKKLNPGDVLLFMGAGLVSDFARKFFETTPETSPKVSEITE